MTDDHITREIERRKAEGLHPMSVKSMDAAFRRLGYVLDRSMDCRGVSRILTGPGAGDSYPCVTTGVRHIATGLSAFNVYAPRDTAFHDMQALRLEAFALTRGAILEA